MKVEIVKADFKKGRQNDKMKLLKGEVLKLKVKLSHSSLNVILSS